MSIFDLDQQGQQSLAEQANLMPLDNDEVSPTAGTGLLKGAALGIAKGGAKAGRAVAMAGQFIPEVIDDATDSRGATDWYQRNVMEPTDFAVDYYTPRAGDVGIAGRVLGGLGEAVLPLMATAGNPALLVGSEALNTERELTKQGVDQDTAAKTGLVQGLATAAGFKLPFLGNTLATRMASGAAGNLATNAGAAAIQSATLTQAGYDKQAEQFDPADMEARAIDTLLGMAFGGLAHVTSPKAPAAAEPQLKPSDVDALLTATNARHFQDETAPGVPLDPLASVLHQQAMEKATNQLSIGQPVDVGPRIGDASFQPRPNATRQEADEAVRSTYREALPADARWAPSQRLAALPLEQRRALRYDAPELNEHAAAIEQQYGLPGGLINALKNAGERSNSSQVSPAGARGVMQFMPENLRKFGVKDASDPVEMIDAAGRYLQETLKRYGGNIDAAIADYNGGPRQARRVLNGEQPAAAETRAYLQRVRDYLGRQDETPPPPSPEQFATRTERRYELDEAGAPTFADGTAYPREDITAFYDRIVAPLAADDRAGMPDVLFRIGRVDEQTAQGLRDFLPGYRDDLSEARISARAIKHIHEQRPEQATEILQRLDEGVLYADEVLPNPNPDYPDRALVVLRNVPTRGARTRSGATVLEVSANGKGVDVVTSMPSKEGYLKKARALAEQKRRESGLDGRQYHHPPLPKGRPPQAHAAADFLTVSPDAPSIAPSPADAKTTSQGDGSAAQDARFQAAEEQAELAPDTPVVLDDGTVTTAGEAMQAAAAEQAQAETDSKAFLAAITCFLRNT